MVYFCYCKKDNATTTKAKYETCWNHSAVGNCTYSIAKPVFKLLSPVAVVHRNAFPLDRQLVL